jgi:hypothetical protein
MTCVTLLPFLAIDSVSPRISSSVTSNLLVNRILILYKTPHTVVDS